MLKKFILSILILQLLTTGFTFSKNKSDFDKNFYIAKQHLSQRRIKKALPYLLYLQKAYPDNDNLKYLVGLCYAEAYIVNPKAIELLSEASKKSSLEYDPNSLEEERVPIYVYYYLCMAYAQNKMCDEAIQAREKFLSVYPYKDKYYIDSSNEWVQICKGMTEKPKIEKLPKFPNFLPYKSDSSNSEFSNGYLSSNIVDSLVIDSNQTASSNKNKSVLTKPINYSTTFPLYGVQLGAYNEVIPVNRFKDLKNVDAFMDHDGLIRYVIGHFSFYSQATSLRDVIKSKGYEDAFVVNVNDARKFSDEVISVNNVNIKANQSRKVEFRVQLGAFKEELTKSSAQLYMKIEGIHEISDQNYTYLTVGKFEHYIEAKGYLKGITAVGIKDAFVIAVSDNQKIALEDVIGVNELNQNEKLNY